jgi:hypothetical protein
MSGFALEPFRLSSDAVEGNTKVKETNRRFGLGFQILERLKMLRCCRQLRGA